MADVIATSEVFASTDAQREVWPTPVEIAKGTALLNGAKAGVAYTASGAHTTDETVGPYTITVPDGGVGLEALEVSVATDGTWMFPVTGATSSTAQGTLIYAVVASGRITSLTTTASGNTLFGRVNLPAGQAASASATPVKIGA